MLATETSLARLTLMEPLLIASLTILALVALMLEYYGRTFTRAFGAVLSPPPKGNSSRQVGH